MAIRSMANDSPVPGTEPVPIDVARELKELLVKLVSQSTGVCRGLGCIKDRGQVQYRSDPTAVERYSHRQMARRFADVLDETTGSKHSKCG